MLGNIKIKNNIILKEFYMKKTMRLSLIISILVISSMSLYAQAIPPDSLYLGQTPPGNSPKVFKLPVSAKSFAAERIAISNDGKNIYYFELDGYTELDGKPHTCRTKYFSFSDGEWKGPFVLFEEFAHPGLSITDNVMYLEKDSHAYYSIKNNNGWSKPERFLTKVEVAHYLQVTNSGNYYVSSIPANNIGGRNISKLIIQGSDTSTTSLGTPLNNTSGDNLDFFVARDESFIITAPGSGLCISYHKNDGSWTNPKSLGSKINFGLGMWGTYVSPDNKYLFYTTGTKADYSDAYVYWVRIDSLIDSLKHTNFTPYLMNPIKNQIDTVGHAFNFSFPDSTFFDDDGNNTLTLTAKLSSGAALPTWLSFNPDTRTFFGVPTQAKVFPIMVTVFAKDTANASASSTFGITIVADPVGVEEDKSQLPKSIYLNQNYPNPFNPTTTIEFAIPKTGRYKLGLYNPLGELVKEISDKEYEAGYHKETFNATGLTSGMYIYRLTGNDANIVRKMVLLR